VAAKSVQLLRTMRTAIAGKTMKPE